MTRILPHVWRLLRGPEKQEGSTLFALEAERRAEIQSIEGHLAEIQAELRALEHSVTILQPGAIPESLRRSRSAIPYHTDSPAEAVPPGAVLAERDHAATLCSLTALEARRDHLRDLLALTQQERTFLQHFLEILRPALPWEEAGEKVRQLCQKPFELSGFYLAQARWDCGEIQFPYFFEVGRPKRMEPIPLEPSSGLTGWALFECAPCCLDSKEACQEHGMLLTDAECRSGLHTKSWFGVPLPSSTPGHPLGLMGFHCFHPKAFSPDRQRLMTTVARLTALHLDHAFRRI